jgi:tetratricopeptide (TPR) repeat protein
LAGALAGLLAAPLAFGEEAQHMPTLRLPGMAPIPLPPRGHALEAIPGDDEPSADTPSPAPRASSPDRDTKVAQPPAPRTRVQTLDDLYARLAAAKDADETNGIIAAIGRLQLDSGSDAGDLLMARAMAAMGDKKFDVALALLDRIIDLQPDWAEAWNKRATVRFLVDDDEGSMADIAHVLKLEPRHFGALAGMGAILERRGFREDALRAYRRALAVAPGLESLRSSVDRLTKAVEGQDL